ncbi:MAG: hypothetical protein Q4G13_06465 [Moraxella sp.]|nr:hypothetical protein [Moraxella sp.]
MAVRFDCGTAGNHFIHNFIPLIQRFVLGAFQSPIPFAVCILSPIYTVLNSGKSRQCV